MRALGREVHGHVLLGCHRARVSDMRYCSQHWVRCKAGLAAVTRALESGEITDRQMAEMSLFVVVCDHCVYAGGGIGAHAWVARTQPETVKIDKDTYKRVVLSDISGTVESIVCHEQRDDWFRCLARNSSGGHVFMPSREGDMTPSRAFLVEHAGFVCALGFSPEYQLRSIRDGFGVDYTVLWCRIVPLDQWAYWSDELYGADDTIIEWR